MGSLRTCTVCPLCGGIHAWRPVAHGCLACVLRQNQFPHSNPEVPFQSEVYGRLDIRASSSSDTRDVGSLRLFCSVWIGRWGWLPVTVVFFGFMALFIQTKYQGEYLEVLYLMAVVLMIAAYWLFCHFPKYKLFHFKD